MPSYVVLTRDGNLLTLCSDNAPRMLWQRVICCRRTGLRVCITRALCSAPRSREAAGRRSGGRLERS